MENDFQIIDEHSILWIDVLPKFTPDKKTNTPHDYEVKKVAESLNSLYIAVNKVEVAYGS